MRRWIVISVILLYSLPVYTAERVKVKIVDRRDSEQEYSYTVPQQQIAYSVRGATLSLLLADGRVVVVNCDSKFKMPVFNWADRRNCRIPVVENVEVEFNKDNARLIWPVSLDGKRTDSETYKIVGIVSKP
jgi:hypothetical protein